MPTREPKNRVALSLRASRVTALVTVALACFALASAKPAFSGWQTFNTDNGLSDDHVTSMLEDRAGNLWFRTWAALSRYDGTNWRTFGSADVGGTGEFPMLEDRAGNIWLQAGHDVYRCDGKNWSIFTIIPWGTAASVYSMLEDRAGSLWFGTTGAGVSRYDGTNWRTFTTADGLAADDVIHMLEDRAGNLWFRSLAGGLSRYDGTSWSTFNVGRLTGYELLSRRMLEDRSGNLWFVSSIGVTRYDGSTWRTFTTADGLASNTTRDLLEDRAGNLWVRTWNGVSRFDGASWRTFTTADGLVSNYVISMLEDGAGNLWFGTNGGGGVSRYDGTGWRTFNSEDSPALGHVVQMLKDRVGNLWFKSSVGVARYDGSSWRTFDATDGLAADSYVISILQDHSRNLWFGCSQGVSRFDGSSWRTFTTADGLVDNNVLSQLEDRAGNLWFGTFYGASRYDGASWRSFTTADGLAGDAVHSLLEDRAGNLWFGTDQGVTRYDGTNWRTFTTADGLADNGAVSIVEDYAGNLWFGSYHGVSRYDGTSWHTFTTADGLPVDALCMLEDRAHNLWVGTNGGGIARYDGTSWHAFGIDDGLPTNYASAIVEDRAGNLWFAMGTRVVRYDGAGWRTFTTADGLVGNIVTSSLEDQAGSLWFGTTGGGVTRYDVDHVPPRAVLLTRPPRLSPSRNQSAAFVAALDEERVEFSYRLDAGPWSAWSPAGSWVGNELQDGMHTLEVRPRDYSTNVDSGGPVASFEIDGTPPTPVIASPAFGQAVKRVVEIRGSATDARFQGYGVEFRPARAASWGAPDATVLTTSTAPVTEGSLASWDTSTLADGDYELRLSVTDTLGLTGSAQVTVVVDNQAPFAGVTAPAKVSAANGGDLYTTHSELHFYFPPHAFDEDALVTIAGAAAPDALPSGATRVQPGYAIEWGSAALRKGATLEFSTAGRTGVPGTQAIYFSSDGNDWRRLGGTSESGKVSLVVREAGHYALYAETGIAGGAATLSDLSFTPRVFSPTGTFASSELAIGFTLGRSSPVTVRVYNRAGRLIRELVAGEPLPAGANLVRWNGRDRKGDVVPDGPYVVTVEALGETRRSPLAVVR